MHWFWHIYTSRSHFPRSRFLKVQICPNQCTHPAYAPLTPHPQMPNRTKNRQIYLPLPYFRRSLSPKNPNLPIFCTLPTKNKHRRGGMRPPSNGLQLIDLNHSTRPTHQPQQAPPTNPSQYKNPADLRPSPQFPQLAPPKTHNLPIFCTFPTKNKHQRGRVRPSPHGIDRRRDLQRRLNSRQVIVFPAIPLSRGTRPHHCEH